MIIDLADIAKETIKYTMDDILDEVKKNKSYVGMIIASRTLDTEEKVKNFYGGEKWERIEGRTLVGAGAGFSIGTECLLKLNGTRGGVYWGYQRGCGEYGSNDVYILDSLRTDHTGGGAAHNNMPPYKVCYIWERIE